MAKVTVIREKPAPQPPPPVREVILTLSQEEAVAIAVLTGQRRVGSSLTGDVYNALRDAGVGWGSPTYKNVKGRMGL